MRRPGGGGVALAALLLALCAAAAPDPARAQQRGGVSVTFGTLGLSDLQIQPVLAQRLDAEGNLEGDPVPLTRSLRTGGGWQVGGSAVLGLTPAWSVRAGAGYGRTRLDARTSPPGEGADVEEGLLEEVRAFDGGADASVATWEAVLRFRLPVEHRLRPHAEVGLGGLRLSAADAAGLAGAAALAGGAHQVAVVAGLGGEWSLLPWLVARLAASTRILATPLRPAEAGAMVGSTDTLAVRFAAPAAAHFADAAVETVRALRLEAGLGVRLGPARPAPTP